MHKLTPQFEELLSREMLEGERSRTIILSVILFCTALWLMMVPSIFHEFFANLVEQTVHGFKFFTLMAMAFAAFGVYELGFALILTIFILKEKNFPVRTRFGNAFIEITFISAMIYFVSKTYIGYETLYTPTIFLYFIFIALSAFRLRISLCIFTGAVAAVEYYLIYYLLITRTGSELGMSTLLSPGMHFTRASIFFLSGVVTGLVTMQIRQRIIKSLEAMEERNSIVNIFGQHVSPAVVNKLLEQKGYLGSEVRYVCTMFLDIRNFTLFSDGRQPQEIVDYLNYLFDFMIEIINRNNGIINKFLGDGFMAVFGAPLSDGHDSKSAVTAAFEIQERLNREIAGKNLPETRIGIGLHAGEAVTGHVGSSLRREYTIIGDVVNLASRIEQLNKRFQSSILISEEVWLSIKDAGFKAEDLGPIDIRGHQAQVRIFKLA